MKKINIDDKIKISSKKKKRNYITMLNESNNKKNKEEENLLLSKKLKTNKETLEKNESNIIKIKFNMVFVLRIYKACIFLRVSKKTNSSEF